MYDFFLDIMKTSDSCLQVGILHAYLEYASQKEDSGGLSIQNPVVSSTSGYA